MRNTFVHNAGKRHYMRYSELRRQEVDRILDLNHGTALPKMELAFAALGRSLSVAVRPLSAADRRQ
jgi:hypothetical protein